MSSIVLFNLSAKNVSATSSQPVYRLYNKNTGEHFYTKSLAEKNSLKLVGWRDEGLGWQSATSGTPVYRLYNPNSKGGDHYYTLSQYEAKSLVKNGWRWDNNGQPAFYSGGNVNLYVAYNPNAVSGAHNYTTNSFEQSSLLRVGWKFGEVAWKTVGSDKPIVKPTLKVCNLVLNVGEKWDPKNNFVSATDKNGKKVDFSKIQVKGSVDTSKSGSYTVTYKYEGIEAKAIIEVKLISKVEVASGGDAGLHRRNEDRSMTQSINSPTGVFLKKGQSIIVSASDYKTLEVSLGQLGNYSYLNQGKYIDKQTVTLSQAKQKITADKGDSEVWIINKSENPTTVEIEGGEKIPLFIKGKTSDKAFKEEISALKDAPFIQISGENVIVNFQYPLVNEVLKKASTQALIENLDKVVELEYELKGSRKDVQGSAHRYNDRILFETPDEGAGYAYAAWGYVAFQKSTGAMLTLANGVANENQWGVYHEVGHTFQEPNQSWNEVNGEVTNNIACEYILYKYGLPSGFVEGSDRYNAVKKYMSLPIAQRKWENLITDHNAKLGLFQNLQVAFGEYFYPRLNQYYREMTLTGEAVDDPQLFIKSASKISNYDLRPFFKEWGLEIKEETNQWFATRKFKTLDKPIWENVYNFTDDLSVDKVDPYTIPTIDFPSNLGEYIVGSEQSPEYFNNSYSRPLASKIIDIKGSSFPTTTVEGLVNGEAEMRVTLTNEAGVSNTISTPVKVKAGNAISLFGYGNNQERVVITLQKNSQQLKALTGDKKTTPIDSGTGKAFGVTHYSKTGEKLEDFSMNREQTPDEFVKQLNTIVYSEGDYFVIHHYKGGAIQSYQDSNIDLKQSDSKSEEYFEIKNNSFVHLPSFKVLNNNFEVNVGQDVEAKSVVQVEPVEATINFESDLDVSTAKEGKVKISVTPKEWLGMPLVQELSYKVLHHNDLSFFGYMGSQERISLSLQKTHKIKVLKNPQFDSIIDSGKGMAFNYTHYNKDLKIKETSTLNKEETPDRFVSEINGKDFEDGDIIQIKSSDKGRLSAYQNGKLNLDKKEANLEEWFKISGEQLTYIGNTKP